MFEKGLDIVRYGIEKDYIVKDYALLGIGDAASVMHNTLEGKKWIIVFVTLQLNSYI